MAIKNILFVCIGNSRSKMAEAFFNSFSKNYKAKSCGVEPGQRIHSGTVQAMAEAGIDISRQKRKRLSDEMMRDADKIIIMQPSLLKEIPLKYRPKLEVWDIEPLLGKSIEQTRKVRNKIKIQAEQLAKELESGKK